MSNPFTDPRKGTPYWLKRRDAKEIEHHRRLIDAMERLAHGKPPQDWRAGTIWQKDVSDG